MANKERKLTTIILKYILSIGFVAIVLILLALFVGNLFFSLGILLPANAAEEYLPEQETILEEHFDVSKISSLYTYALFDPSGNLVESNMSQNDLRTVKQNNGDISLLKNGTVQYRVYNWAEGMIVLRYEIKAKFSNPTVNRFLPYPEFLFVILFFFLLLLYCYIVARRLSKMVTLNMQPIIGVTQQIGKQELDFEMPPTRITEFREINTALEKMRKL